MARKGQFRARPGFERIPGALRLYKDLRTGETITKRQMVKRTENVKSLEVKRDAYRRVREARGEPEPMQRYNAIVAQYKLTHGPTARVRGKDSKEFRDAIRIYTTTRKRTRAANLARVRAGAILGTIAPAHAQGLYPELRDDPAVSELDEFYSEFE
jgi:hypothetical protein